GHYKLHLRAVRLPSRPGSRPYHAASFRSMYASLFSALVGPPTVVVVCPKADMGGPFMSTPLMTQHAQIAERKHCGPHARLVASARSPASRTNRTSRIWFHGDVHKPCQLRWLCLEHAGPQQ